MHVGTVRRRSVRTPIVLRCTHFRRFRYISVFRLTRKHKKIAVTRIIEKKNPKTSRRRKNQTGNYRAVEERFNIEGLARNGTPWLMAGGGDDFVI